MFIGETPQFTFMLDESFGIDLNDAQEIEVRIDNNGSLLKTFLKTSAAPDNVKVAIDGLSCFVNLQRATSQLAKSGRVLIQLSIKLPAADYPNYPGDGFHSIAQITEPVLKSI